MNTRYEEKLKELPEVPKAFGEDGGYFYRYYDALADEIDDDMVKSLKAQLDGILIYVRTIYPLPRASDSNPLTLIRLVFSLASTLHFSRSRYPR